MIDAGSRASNRPSLFGLPTVRMPRRLLLGLLGVVAVVQLAVPGWTILQHEEVLREGSEYRFRTAPVDPYDAFRGRYVALGFADTVGPVPDGLELQRRMKVFVPLQVDEEGFATLGEATRTRPLEDHLELRVMWWNAEGVTYELPFSRFYMEEEAAPEAERVYRENNGEGRPAYVTVRVKNGRGVLEELYVDDLPILERLQRGP